MNIWILVIKLKLALFGWAVVITAVLLLLSLPVLAGGILPALNLAVFWEPLYNNISQSAGNLLSLNFLGNFRGHTPKYFGLEIFTFPFCTTLRSINTDNNSKNLNKSLFSYYFTGLVEGDGTIITPKTLRTPKGKLNYPGLRFRKSLVREKLSNSGEYLKLLISNFSWKAISGQINYLCMVILQKIPEKVMGNRGSKSTIYENIAVKEQRVNGSYVGQPTLKCTLMGLGISYQVKILSNHINSNKKSFSTLTTLQPVNINAWFITGFADGESSFIISVVRSNKNKTGWSVKPKFQLALHNKDAGLLIEIQKYFGVGRIYKNGADSYQFRVESIKELKILINHFDSYGLITQKWSDYQLFKQGI